MEALENLEVWKRSCQLSVKLYKALADCREYGFRDQITRSALSIPSNIAEGYERDSQKSCIQYLRVAKGSSGELWTQLFIGRKAGFLDQEMGQQLEKEAREISKMLHGLIQYYKKIK
ncbi:MAG: four helix bundle protein [Gammaproteobacteria bacterium]|nr:MAG: four helix bundle protein [Gammaproteobacteria bacterium]